MTDWKAIREEYVTGELSMRALAEKRGVNFNTLKTHALNGVWTEKRREYRKMQDTPASPHPGDLNLPPCDSPGQLSHLGEALSGTPMDPEMEEVFNVARLMLKNIGDLMRRGVQAYEMRALSDSLQDVREILQSRPVLDAEEQRARIDRLQAEIREYEKDPKDNKVEIVFRDGADKYAV